MGKEEGRDGGEVVRTPENECVRGVLVFAVLLLLLLVMCWLLVAANAPPRVASVISV